MEITWSIIKEIINKRNSFVEVVFRHSACVGQEVLRVKLKQSNKPIRFINLQKARLDLLLDRMNGQPRPKVKILKPFILKQEAFDFYRSLCAQA